MECNTELISFRTEDTDVIYCTTNYGPILYFRVPRSSSYRVRSWQIIMPRYTAVCDLAYFLHTHRNSTHLGLATKTSVQLTRKFLTIRYPILLEDCHHVKNHSRWDSSSGIDICPSSDDLAAGVRQNVQQLLDYSQNTKKRNFLGLFPPYIQRRC